MGDDDNGSVEPVPPISFVGRRWFVVYTLARCEERAQLGLQAKGFETFLPTLIREVRHARRVAIAKRPLFPRYLFCRFDMARQEWFWPIKSTNGVAALLKHQDIPARVPDGAIAHWQDAQARGDFDLTRPAALPFAPGDIVRVISSAFSGYNAQVLRVMPAAKRVQALLDCFGRETVINLPWGDVERAP